MLLVLMAASAIVPSLLLVWYFRSRDRNPEPARIVWRTFLYGILAVAPILVVAVPTGNWARGHQGPFLVAALEAVFAAAVPEEFFKFLVVTGYSARQPDFDEPMDGIVYGAVASLGFATLENVLYVTEHGFGTAVMRAVTAVPGHACTGAIMGYFVGRMKFARSDEERSAALRWALGLPMALHAGYDFPLMAMHHAGEAAGAAGDATGATVNPLLVLGLMASTVAVFALEVRLARRFVKRLRAEQDAVAPLAPSNPVGPIGPMDPIGPMGVLPEMPLPLQAPPKPEHHYVGGLVRLIFGGSLATAGALGVLGSVVVLLAPAEPGDPSKASIAGVLVLGGLLPIWIGLRLFRRGLRLLHE